MHAEKNLKCHNPDISSLYCLESLCFECGRRCDGGIICKLSVCDAVHDGSRGREIPHFLGRNNLCVEKYQYLDFALADSRTNFDVLCGGADLLCFSAAAQRIQVVAGQVDAYLAVDQLCEPCFAEWRSQWFGLFYLATEGFGRDGRED